MTFHCIIVSGFVLFSLFSFSGVGHGQTPRPPILDFSGDWKLKKVTESQSPLMSKGGPQKTDIQSNITQDSTSLKVKKDCQFDDRKYSRNLEYYLDGRGETNPSDEGKFILSTKTQLKVKELIVDGIASDVGTKKEYGRQKEEWEISSDGETLTITHTSYAPGDRQSIFFQKLIYTYLNAPHDINAPRQTHYNPTRRRLI